MAAGVGAASGHNDWTFAFFDSIGNKFLPSSETVASPSTRAYFDSINERIIGLHRSLSSDSLASPLAASAGSPTAFTRATTTATATEAAAAAAAAPPAIAVDPAPGLAESPEAAALSPFVAPTCPICITELGQNELFLPLACSHVCCFECMSTHIRMRIQERDLPIPCPLCAVAIEPRDVMLYVSPALFKVRLCVYLSD